MTYGELLSPQTDIFAARWWLEGAPGFVQNW